MPRLPRKDTIGRAKKDNIQGREERVNAWHLPGRGIVKEKLAEEFFGMEIAVATSPLTLSTTDQSIPGDGDNNNVRIILPRAGMWLVIAVCDLNMSATGTGLLTASLYVDDAGSPETADVVQGDPGSGTHRGTQVMSWVVTTLQPLIPIELKAAKEINAGTGTIHSGSRLIAIGGFQ